MGEPLAWHGGARVNFVTDFADQAVILPLVLGMAMILGVLGWARGGLAWLVATIGTFGLMLLLKLLFLGCGSLLVGTGITSPSGHAAAAALVAGALVAVFIDSRPWVIAAAVFAASTIGLTRIALGAHSVPEVILGGVVGLGGAVALHRMAGPPPPLRLLPIGLVAGAVLVMMHGTRLPAERTIRHTADLLGRIIPDCHRVPPAWSDRTQPTLLAPNGTARTGT